MANIGRDEVDEIVDAWASERPDLDVSPLQVLSRISRLARRLDQARATTFTEHGLDGWEFDVLSALRRAGSPYELSPSALVQQTLVTSGTMTNRVDRLVTRSLVTRRPDPGDRRGVLVALTDDGLRVVDAALADLLVREQRLLEALPARERERLSTGLRRLLSAVEHP
ncbi:MarR family winged helix-turn-helix transcriptional regulator [Dermacoccaceae bacterium W4C1]